MKKFITTALALTMIMSLCVPAFAMDIVSETAEERALTQAREIAYMDVSSVDAEMKSEILEAREQVILSESWVADGVSGCILDKNGNVKEVLSEFHDIFPDDWAMPLWATESNDDSDVKITRSSSWVDNFYDGDVYLREPSTTVNTPAFCSFSTGNDYYYVDTVNTYGVYQNTTVTATYNIGYSNASTVSTPI